VDKESRAEQLLKSADAGGTYQAETADYQLFQSADAGSVDRTSDHQLFQPIQKLRSKRFHYLNRALKQQN
jgi:hypothetical protein